MNTYAKMAIGAAAVAVVAIIGLNLLSTRFGSTAGGPTESAPASPTTVPSPGPALLARGTFSSHGVTAQLDATGAGAGVTGTMTVSDAGQNATIALECSRTTDGGLIEIGGLVTDSTFSDGFPAGRRVAIIFQRGSPVKAVWYVALVAEAPVDTCQALVDDVIDPKEVSPGLEPIEGIVEFAP